MTFVILTMLCVGAAGVSWLMPCPAALRLREASGRSEHWSGNEAIAAYLGRMRHAQRRKQRTQRHRGLVIELCDGLAAELAAGRSPETALASTVERLDLDFLSEVAERGTNGVDDIPSLLVRASAVSGAEGLRLLAACWRIGAERGGTFARVVDGLTAALRDEQAQREEIAAQLAGPRATARLLAVLPLLGIAMAAALGAHPVVFLLASPAGWMCVLLGVGLDVLGLWWTARLAAGAERTR